MLVNAKIEEAGLYYNGHYRHCSLRIVLRTRGGGASIELPVDRTEEFMEMFADELDLQNGVFVSDLKDVPVVLKTDGKNEYAGEIKAIGNILASEDALMPLDKEEK